ncbi:MAG: cupin domain-containing protein [Xanthomonadales bacterium]|uniref:cupin domain-containing protein n=1 Tax=Hydrogenophaga sp. TaxID=1904254 RepID=UPI0016A2F56E|nr:cupin domain-containing protein [Hydrogenophaga sp.]NIM69679.1 cupin domain-containing protein [Xanthomonadales bacterium]NIN30286.1 cupin domain-containing protein [Hydrogenophaga sp.]NIN59076.1 cupin domain-containing protein [Xanthomonadales bacterium]NIN74387.1 cupin domain-containing protein [Xanthomonadales bacterium]NIO13192.1 cupin domain-containing protein [Xanthomonadales bacterium]
MSAAAPLGALTVEDFLARHWQRTACHIPGAIPGFEPPLDEHDLAGLACEPDANARLVAGRYPDHDWRVRHGPFEESVFAGLGAQHWTLLVQDVEKHYPPLQSFLARFRFLPQWRLDDLMISYAVTGGSVGPHVDQYDVFLFQASGRRRWQIATTFDPALVPDCPLRVLAQFTPEQEWVLAAGDLLYLPPGIAHHGVALEPGMTWSVGLRAPSAAELLIALGEELALTPGEGGRYRDPPLAPGPRAGEITTPALQGLAALLDAELTGRVDFPDFAGRFLTRFRLAQEPEPRPAPVGTGEVERRLRSGARVARNPWTRLAWIEERGRARLYAAGARYPCSLDLAAWLCDPDGPGPLPQALADDDLAALSALLNDGHLRFRER